MHYSDGTEAKVGDVVHVSLQPGFTGSEFIGVLVSGTASSNTCNGLVDVTLQRQQSALGMSQWFRPSGGFPTYITIGEAHKLL